MSVLKCSASPLCSQMPFTVGWWGYLLIPSCQQAQKGAALLPAHVLLHTPTCHALPRIESLYLSLLLTWAKHAPVFWRPLWNCHVLRHLCCGSNYITRRPLLYNLQKVSTICLVVSRRAAETERLEICVRPVFVSRHWFPLLLHHLL